jgi:hypothetical protein
VKGIVDSSDLPLNVSREILQESRIVRVIRKQLIRRSLEMIEGLAKKEGGEDYKTFWENFGRNIKVGILVLGCGGGGGGGENPWSAVKGACWAWPQCAKGHGGL